ncbi:MAG: phytanoyl-CoA dioxygenase family protein [Acidimicrobiia bacterium]|nr:phytanoyl-CoA dioxygenase family protein [Acidimicrobiia bacterium]
MTVRYNADGAGGPRRRHRRRSTAAVLTRTVRRQARRRRDSRTTNTHDDADPREDQPEHRELQRPTPVARPLGLLARIRLGTDLAGHAPARLGERRRRHRGHRGAGRPAVGALLAVGRRPHDERHRQHHHDERADAAPTPHDGDPRTPAARCRGGTRHVRWNDRACGAPVRRGQTGPVGPDVRERLEIDGYAIARGVLDRDTVSAARRHLEQLLATHPDRRPEQLTHELMAGDRFWQALVGDPRLLDLVEPLVGPDIALFASHWICKPPVDGQEVRWHQDAAYWPLEPMEVVTVWLAVDPSTVDNGCLRVLPGTHRGPLRGLRPTDGDDVLGSELDGVVDESAAVDVELEPGDVEIHDPGIVHGSRPNTSPHRRAGLTIRYIPTTTRITDPDRAHPLLLRGRPRPGINQYRDVPPVAGGPASTFVKDEGS